MEAKAAEMHYGGRGHEPRKAGSFQKVEKTRRPSPLEPLQTTSPATPLSPSETDFGLLTSKTLREYICVAFSHSV